MLYYIKHIYLSYINLLCRNQNLHAGDSSSRNQTTHRYESDSNVVHENNHSIASSLSEAFLVCGHNDAATDRQADLEVSQNMGRIHQVLSASEIDLASNIAAKSATFACCSAQRGHHSSARVERSFKTAYSSQSRNSNHFDYFILLPKIFYIYKQIIIRIYSFFLKKTSLTKEALDLFETE